MGLPWVRLDANIAAHDKILALLSDPSATKWQAVASYMFSTAWSGGAGTDGYVPRTALPFVHGTSATARLLEKYGLWTEAPAGWRIPNFDKRQPLTAAAESVRQTKQKASAKGNCIRHHGPDCGCWQETA
jgi:hypothetical protein